MSASPQQAIQTLQFLHPGGEVFEICIIAPRQNTSRLWEGRAFGKKQIVAGWFRDREKAANLAVQIAAEGVYVTLNPCQEALLARAHERLKANVDRTTDQDIAHLHNLLIDIDPRRPAGISSSEAEHDAALDMAEIIRADLAREGWPEPLVGDSGNGGHLIYGLDLANTSGHVDLLKAVLAALAQRYAPALHERNLEIDQKVFNPARLTKLYGTRVAKGDDLPDRPHRVAQILSLPQERQAVPLGLLHKLALTVPPAESGARGVRVDKPGQKKAEQRFDLEAYLQHYGVEVVKVKPHGGGQLHCLQECVFDSSHSNNEAAIGQTEEGKLFYQCFHNSCRERTWAEAREAISGRDSLKQFMSGPPKPRRKKKAPAQEPPVATGGFSRSDLGNARRLVAMHGQDLRYCYKNKKWYVWNDRYWAIDFAGEVERRAKQTVASIYQEASQYSDRDDRKALAQFALRSEHQQRIQAMVRLAQSEPGVPVQPEDLDAHEWLFNCVNGTIDLRTGELREHRREELITCISPVPYEPGAECEAWEKFLYQIQDNRVPVIFFLQQALGYTLTGNTREQCLFILWGGGANGKSTLLNAVREIMGDYARHTPTETLLAKTRSGEIPTDVARLDGPRLVTASEVDRGRRLAESLIKELTGQDTVAARFLYGEYFDFQPQFKLFLSTNNKPVIRGSDDAIWRRVKFIRFPVQIPEAERDKDLPEKLWAEAPGILAWMVRGCRDWYEHGLETPEEVRSATDEYRAEMDMLQDFLSDCCLIGPTYSASAKELYQEYLHWAEENGLKEKEQLKQRTFGMALAERGFQRDKGTAGLRIWRGVGLMGD